MIIYDATSNAIVPTVCKNVSTSGSPPYGVNGVCNVYTGAEVTNALTGSFTGSTCVGGWDAAWCPTTRVREPNPGRVGIYLEVHYDPVTGAVAA